MAYLDSPRVCKQVGIVHGPIKTQFGHHLIITHQRTGDAEAKKGGCG